MLNRYAERLQAEKRAREVDHAGELQRHTAKKFAHAPAEPNITASGTKGRRLGSERLTKDEELRQEWGGKEWGGNEVGWQ